MAVPLYKPRAWALGMRGSLQMPQSPKLCTERRAGLHLTPEQTRPWDTAAARQMFMKAKGQGPWAEIRAEGNVGVESSLVCWLPAQHKPGVCRPGSAPSPAFRSCES